MSKVGETIRVPRPASLVLLWWAPLRGCTRKQYQHAPSRRACGDTAASNYTAVSYCQVLLLEYLRQQTLIRLYRVPRVWCTSVEAPLSITTGLSASRSFRLYVNATMRRAGNVCSQTHSLIRSESSPHQTWMPFSSSCCLRACFILRVA